MSKYKDKEKLTNAMLGEIVPIADADLLAKEPCSLNSMDDVELGRVKGCVHTVWTFTVSNPAPYHGKHGKGKKTDSGSASSFGGDDDLPVCVKGAIGSAKADVMKRRLICPLAYPI